MLEGSSSIGWILNDWCVVTREYLGASGEGGDGCEKN